MVNKIIIQQGLNIPIDGSAENVVGGSVFSERIGLNPADFHGVVPKLLVKEGDFVLAGQPLFYNKNCESMKFVSPVSGKIIAINRGERRKIIDVIIERDIDVRYKCFNLEGWNNFTPEKLKFLLLEAGLWVFIKQRPFDVIAAPTSVPKAVFISLFDTSPLAPDLEYVLKDQKEHLQRGVDVLCKITGKEVYVAVNRKDSVFSQLQHVTMSLFSGPHPSGNVGVHINKLNPINKGEVIWTIHPQDLVVIGKFVQTGKVQLEKLIAITGPEVLNPQYYNVFVGTSIARIVENKLSVKNPLRLIAGNVLSGNIVAESNFLDFYSNQITVIEDGNQKHELLGWAMPRIHKYSSTSLYLSGLFEKSFFRKLFGTVQYRFDSRMLGGQRAMIFSGIYEKVFPMDIMPEFLLKAMITSNVDKMESLGIYEVAPEDFALCEFVCPSKLPIQQIVREALDYMIKETE